MILFTSAKTVRDAGQGTGLAWPGQGRAAGGIGLMIVPLSCSRSAHSPYTSLSTLHSTPAHLHSLCTLLFRPFQRKQRMKICLHTLRS